MEVPFGTELFLSEQERAQRDLFQAAYVHGGLTVKEQLAWMREHGHGIISDAVGRVRTPRERELWNYDYWQSRQNVLPFDTDGCIMKPHEIEFAESFVLAGYQIKRWLPQNEKDIATGLFITQNDFELPDGKQVELKRANRKIRRTKQRISDSLSKGKHIFFIDFGDKRPPENWVRALKKYSPNKPGLEQIWGYWDGNLVRFR